MMRKVLFLLVITITMFACSQQNQQTEATVENYQISELVINPLNYENDVVRFEGMISHICRHSGDKMRIVQTSDDSYSILVLLGDMASQFNPEMEGQEVTLVGTLKAQLVNAEPAETDHDHDHHDHDHEEGHACSSTEEAMQKLIDKGIDPDLRAYVELIGME